MSSKEDPKILKEKILKTALGLAEEGHWSQVSIRKISREINYSTIMIYSLFGSKEKLFDELRDHGFDILYKIFQETVHQGGEDKQIILNLSEEVFRFYEENTELYQVMFGIVGIPGVSHICQPGSSAQLTADLVSKILIRIMEGERYTLFQNWWALIHGYISISSTLQEEYRENLRLQYSEAISRFLNS